MLIERVQLTNLLSFGPDSLTLDLEPLNVLIGPNGSGKSNLIEALGLLAAAPENIGRTLHVSGDVTDWIWRRRESLSEAEIRVVVASSGDDGALSYRLGFGGVGKFLQITNEVVESATDQRAETKPARHLVRPAPSPIMGARPAPSEAVLTTADGDRQPYADLDPEQSVLARVGLDPLRFPHLFRVADALRGIAIYGDWTFEPSASLRQPPQPDLPSDRLLSDAANLGLVLNVLNQDTQSKQRLVEKLRELYDGISDLRVNIERNAAHVHIHEDGLAVPAMRLSDGTLRYLCLLAILCHPNPPALVCLEEPELGLHPDILSGLGDLLVDASQRCQLIVTTHSEVLVDKLTDSPNSVVVCEKHEGQTQMRRLDGNELSSWLERYGSLGDLWTRGRLGGNRW